MTIFEDLYPGKRIIVNCFAFRHD